MTPFHRVVVELIRAVVDLSRIADRISIFGNGRILKNVETAAEVPEILEKIAGVPCEARNAHLPEADRPPVLRVKELSMDTMENLSFDVYAGECLVLQDSCNRVVNPLLQILAGERAAEAGQLWMENRPCVLPRKQSEAGCDSGVAKPDHDFSPHELF